MTILRPRAALTRLATAVGLTAVALAGSTALPAQAAPYCDPGTSYTITRNGWNWYAFDAGTVKNTSSRATIHKTILHSTSQSKTSTKSAELGLEVSAWVTKVNAKFGYSVSKTVSYTTTTSFTVDVPPNTTVRYKDGIIVRHFNVKRVDLYDNCHTRTTYGSFNAADNYSVVTDA